MGFPGGAGVKNASAMQEMGVQFLGQKEPLKRKWQPLPVFLPGKLHGQRCLEDSPVHGFTKRRRQLSD